MSPFDVFLSSRNLVKCVNPKLAEYSFLRFLRHRQPIIQQHKSNIPAPAITQYMLSGTKTPPTLKEDRDTADSVPPSPPTALGEAVGTMEPRLAGAMVGGVREGAGVGEGRELPVVTVGCSVTRELLGNTVGKRDGVDVGTAFGRLLGRDVGKVDGE
jgi:hypothetical protein